MPINKILKYKLPGKLDSQTKELIEKSFFGAIEEMGIDEYKYICKKIHKKIDITINSATSWVSEVSLYYSTLFKVIDTEIEISEEAFNLIGAALFYFINPFDIIPDYTPGVGYLDDLYVLKICIKSLKKNDKLIVGKYLKKYASK